MIKLNRMALVLEKFPVASYALDIVKICPKYIQKMVSVSLTLCNIGPSLQIYLHFNRLRKY